MLLSVKSRAGVDTRPAGCCNYGWEGDLLLDFFHDKKLDLIAFFKVVEFFNGQAAFIRFGYFLHIVLKTAREASSPS